jgi:excisionase family DNA binding protein
VPTVPPGPFLSFAEACNYLGVQKSTLYAISAHELAYYLVGRKRRYKVADLDGYIESKRIPERKGRMHANRGR